MTITSPFTAQSTATEVVAGHDLSKKTVLITGASSGIGVETARALLSAQAEVILAVRDPVKSERVAQQLREATGNPRISILVVDLGSLASIRQAVEQFYTRWSRLHALINNAGIMATPLSYTPDGFELQFGTNHLGHFLLTHLLLPALQKASPARVVVLSSSAHRLSDVHFGDLNYQHRSYDKWEAYAQSKTANALFAVGLTQQFGSQGITANAVNPGGTATGLQQHLTLAEMRALGWVDEGGTVTSRLRRPEQGAATPVWAAVGAELEGIGGRYLEWCQEAVPYDPSKGTFHGYMPYALDPERAERLWEISQDLVGCRTDRL